MELHLAMERNKVPDVHALDSFAAKRALPLEFPRDFTLARGSGFEPAKLLGDAAGVEIYRDENLAELFKAYPTFERLAEHRNFGVSFRCGRRLSVVATALGLSVILVGDCEATAYDPADDVPWLLGELQSQFDGVIPLIRQAKE